MAVILDSSSQLKTLYQAADQNYLQPLWTVPPSGNEPRDDVKPWLWRWHTLRTLLHEAAEVVPVGVDGAERRVFNLRNPSLPAGTTRTIGASVQLVRPGEQAPSHRHTMAAMRFVVEGTAGFTVVEGEPLSMEPGDFVLTPAWTWHGHANEGSTNMLWLDILDAPLVRSLNCAFYEEYAKPPSLQPPNKPRDDSAARYRFPSLLPARVARPSSAYSPLLSYKWEPTRQALFELDEVERDLYDGAVLAYTNPFTGGPVLPTVGTTIQLLRAGEATRAHRHTSNAVYHVAEGHGSSVINGVRFDWERGDTFCVPTWCWHEHAAAPDSHAILFAATDVPVLQALDLLREEAFAANGGRQPVTGSF